MEQAIRDGAQRDLHDHAAAHRRDAPRGARHPGVRMLNCSVDMPYPGVRTYYGRVYEGKFITRRYCGRDGRDGKIGYVADYPIYGVPPASTPLRWARRWSIRTCRSSWLGAACPGTSPAEISARRGVKIVSNRDIPTPGGNTPNTAFSLMDDSGSFWPLASPVWNWGRLYERIVRSILDDSWYREADGARAVNYWWGMSSGVIDVMLDECLPEGVKVLAQALAGASCSPGSFTL